MEPLEVMAFSRGSPFMEREKRRKQFSSSKPTFPLLSLQPELILHVISFLEARQLLDISQSCKLVYDVYSMNSNFLWRQMCQRKFQLSEEMCERKDVDWKTYFYERRALQKEGSFDWTLMNDSIKERPSPRMCHSGTSVSGSGIERIAYVGGQSGQTQRFEDIYLFDGNKFQRVNNVLRSAEKPQSFARHSSVSIGNKIYTFGGFDGVNLYFGVAVFDLERMTWTYPDTTGDAPKLKTNHAAAAIGTKMYVFGGNRTEEGNYSIYDDLHVLDTETMTWTRPQTYGAIPGQRVAHKLVAVGKRLYLFGGGKWSPKEDWIERTKKIHILDTETMTWSCPTVVGEDNVRVSSFSIPLVFSTFIFFFGGQSIVDGNELNDLISFDTVSHRWERHDPAPHKDNPGQRSVATLNMHGEYAWLFAGSDSFDLSNSVHRLSHPIFKKRKYARPTA